MLSLMQYFQLLKFLQYRKTKMSLSEAIKKERIGRPTGSGVHEVMGGWQKALVKPEKPPEAEQYLVDWIKPLYLEGRREFRQKDAVKEIDKKPAVAEINAAIEVIKFDLPPVPPEGMMTYAKKLAIDEMYEQDPDEWDGNRHTKNGEYREPDIVKRIVEITKGKFRWVHTCLTDKTDGGQKHYVDEEGILGVTPDGVALHQVTRLPITGLEAKARMRLNHNNQLFIHDNETLKKMDFSRYCQSQAGMHCLKSDHYIVASFNPYPKHSYQRLKFKAIRIERDQQFIDLMLERCRWTIELKDKYIAQTMAAVEKGSILGNG